MKMEKFTMKNYKLERDFFPEDTSFRHNIFLIAPTDLVRVFGKATNETDSYKVSGEYVFTLDQEDEKQLIFTLYDWKSTTLYDPDAKFTPNELWNSTKPFDFHIGVSLHASAMDIQDFIEWLKEKVKTK